MTIDVLLRKERIRFAVYFYSAGLQALLAEGIMDFALMLKIKMWVTDLALL